jgi:hypothetical protein
MLRILTKRSEPTGLQDVTAHDHAASTRPSHDEHLASFHKFCSRPYKTHRSGAFTHHHYSITTIMSRRNAISKQVETVVKIKPAELLALVTAHLSLKPVGPLEEEEKDG